MSGYTLIWWPPAQRDLADLWLASDDRQGLTDATNDIDRQLARSPREVGEPSHEGLRRLLVAPLLVHYSIDDGDRKVTVVSVQLVI